ncbi:glycosyl hydrolase family 28 protein [Luteolibacter sp. Y139]|uniref:Glycosyl hydrolase family 28 protein n=1 Tax=Luteolibacter soli TaxID=3135280 RepID=A0ABU9AQ31_9BACT
MVPGEGKMPEAARVFLAHEVAASGHSLKTRASIALVALFASVSSGADTTPVIPPPEIPSLVKEVAASDGTALATAAIQQALDAVRDAGGGRVVLPAGRFRSGPLVLGNKTELHLSKASVLVMSDQNSDFPAEGNRRPAFLSASNAHDIRISGEGTIEGQGERWWKIFLDEKARGIKDAPRRPQLIAISRCERVEVEGISTIDPPNTHYSFKDCQDLAIRGIKAIAPDDSPNTDALNLSSVHNVLIEHCHISTGDDNIVLLCSAARKKGVPEVENVLIRDCTLGFGHGLSIGSYTSGGVRNVTAENITFDGTTSGIRMKAWRDRGGVVEDIHYRNIAMKHVRYPVWITSYYPKPPAHPSEDQPSEGKSLNPVWRDISIENLTVTDSPNSILLWGLPDQSIDGVTIKNSKISAETGALVFHAKNIGFANVSITPAAGPALRHFDAEIQGLKSENYDDKPVKSK